MNREHLRPPVEHRKALLRPDVHGLRHLVEKNRALAERSQFMIAGGTAGQLRREVRSTLLGLAREYTQRINPGASIPERDPEAPLIVTGHQPELYHPGVWFKNHLADRLARAVGGTSINVVLDSDAPSTLGLAVPVRTGEEVELRAFHYAKARPGRTWEEHRRDESWRVEEFVREVTGALPGKTKDSLFAEFGAALREYAGKAKTAAELVTAARVRVERKAGLENRELCISEMCSTRGFTLFVLAILCDLERFRKAYNDALAWHRDIHRERGKANPVPDLGPGETPFWAYEAGGPRRALRLAPDPHGLSLALDDHTFFTMDNEELARFREGARGTCEEMAEELLRHAADKGIRIRTRALTTTMFLRLFLADAFIHGIGGTHYEAVTDEIIRRYFGVTPPGFITASATMHLPFEKFPGTADDVRTTKALLRDLEWNPGRHLAETSPVLGLVALKRELIAKPRGLTRPERKWVFEELRAANGELRPLVQDQLERAREDLSRLQHNLAMNRILTGREYAFALFGRDELLGFYRNVLALLK